MLRRLWISMQRDHQINWRNWFFLITVMVALVYFGIYLLVPKSLSVKPSLFLVDQTSVQAFAKLATSEQAAQQAILLQEPAEIEARMKANKSSVGLLLQDGTPLPQVTLYFQGHENERVRRLLELSIEEMLRQIYQQQRPVDVAIEALTLREQLPAEKPSFRDGLVPIFLFVDAAMLGMLFIGALMFMEKEEGTLQAYLTTPGRSWEYLLSKSLTLGILPVLYVAIMVPLTLGTGPNYLHLILLMVLGAIFTTLLGAWLAVYFKSLTQFLFPLIIVIVVLGLPAASYTAPSFSPLWLRAIPSYPLIFGLREAAFPTGNPQIVYTAALTMLALDVAILIVGSWAFQRKLARS